MNKSYALVWNQAQGCWNVASEGARRRGKSGGARRVIAAHRLSSICGVLGGKNSKLISGCRAMAGPQYL